eukprot:m.306722 g.306722  ORF g.306722 m.306722 type:complete len:389 (+) comp41532_c0_seq1:18-1184(+)
MCSPVFAVDYPLYAIVSLKEGRVLVAGGGGSSKTGVPNRVEIYELTGRNGQIKKSCVCSQDVGNRSVMNASVDPAQRYVSLGQDASCRILRLSQSGFASPVPAKSLVRWRKPTARWNLETFAEKVTDFGIEGGFQKVVRFNLSGGILATGGADGRVRTWKFPVMMLGWVLEGHDDEVDDLAFHHSRDQLVSVSRDCSAFVWNLTSGKCVEMLNSTRIAKPGSYRHRTCRFGSRGSQVWLYTGFVPTKGANSSYLCCFHGETYKLLSYATVSNDTITKVDTSSGGNYVAAGTMGGSVIIYQTADGGLQLVKQVDHVHQAFVTGLAFVTVMDWDKKGRKKEVGEGGFASISIDRTCKFTNLEGQKSFSIIFLFSFPLLMFILFYYIFLTQ